MAICLGYAQFRILQMPVSSASAKCVFQLFWPLLPRRKPRSLFVQMVKNFTGQRKNLTLFKEQVYQIYDFLFSRPVHPRNGCGVSIPKRLWGDRWTRLKAIWWRASSRPFMRQKACLSFIQWSAAIWQGQIFEVVEECSIRLAWQVAH